MKFLNVFAGGAVCLCLSGCGMWPYKSDFDCPIPQGEKCLSLYEVNKLAEAGKYVPETGLQKKSECPC